MEMSSPAASRASIISASTLPAANLRMSWTRTSGRSSEPASPSAPESVRLPQQPMETLMPKRKAKAAPRYADQPAVAAMLKLLRQPRGATVAEIAKARGLQPHTVRSVLSMLGSKAGLEFTRTKVEGRGATVYRALAKP